MPEYISREAATVYAPLPKHLRNYQTENLDDAWEDGYDYAISQIDAIPAADVVEVRHGRWIPVTEKLPKAYEDVLLLFPHNQAAGFCDRDGCWGVYSGDGFYTEVADNEPKPTHWARKLTKPPKEETK